MNTPSFAPPGDNLHCVEKIDGNAIGPEMNI